MTLAQSIQLTSNFQTAEDLQSIPSPNVDLVEQLATSGETIDSIARECENPEEFFNQVVSRACQNDPIKDTLQSKILATFNDAFSYKKELAEAWINEPNTKEQKSPKAEEITLRAQDVMASHTQGLG